MRNMISSSTMMIAFLCTIASSANAWQAPSLPYEKYSLKNGLEIILQHDDRIPYVAVSVWYHVGAIEEQPGKTGFAHLFEHLMFQGTPHVGEDKHFAYLQEAGATATNGTTNFDRTNYFEVVPSNELELALWLESDRMGWLMQGVTQEKLDEQRGVVKNERLQRTDNQPYGKAEEKSWQTLFSKTHPYHGLIIGSLEDLDRASLDDVRQFFYRYYTPQNATLAIVGNFDPKTIKSTIEKYFGTLKGTPKPPPATIKAAQLNSEIKLIETDPLAKLTKVQLQYLTPAILTAGDANFDVISNILSGDKSSRLTRALLFDQQLAQSVVAAQWSLLSTSVFTISVLLQEGVDSSRVRDIIDAQLQTLITNPPTTQEISRAVNKIRTERLIDLQKIGGHSGRAEQLQAYNHYLGDPDSLQQDLARYDQVTPQSIVDNVKRYLAAKKRILLIVVPNNQSMEIGETP